MSATNPGKCKALTTNSPLAINNSEPQATERLELQDHIICPLRTEHPLDSPNLTRAYVSPHEEATIGNPQAILWLKKEGMLGNFYPPSARMRTPALVEVNFDNIRGAVQRVLRSVISDLAKKQRAMDNQLTTKIVDDLILHLSNGVCVMIYMKLYNVNYFDRRVTDRYRRKPRVPEPFEVPSPYALAITHLGAIKLSSMVKELYLSPSVPAGAENNYGCQADFIWSPDEYSRRVVQAKKLGLRFSSVDLKLKLGSSWWLFRPVNEGRTFRFDIPYPEDNFTNNDVILAALFANNAKGGFANAIVNTASLGDETYRSFMRNLPVDISVSCYNAVIEVPEVVSRAEYTNNATRMWL